MLNKLWCDEMFPALLVCFLSFVNGAPQVNQITQFLNNVTVQDVSHLLKYLPIPNPVAFDGDPVYDNDVLFYLYTRRNPEYPLAVTRDNLKHSIIDPNYPVKFVVHGWLEDANRTYVKNLIDAYMRRGEYNVVAVDWSRPAGSFDYTQASRNTKTTGKAIGNFIIRLYKSLRVPYDMVHILGHSLGAHAAGFAGKQVYSKTKNKIGRISALDAAGPLFEIPVPVDKSLRVDKGDASFVDAIHTDGGIFGAMRPFGHVDFYPNGGVPRQPGCRWINVWGLSTSVLIDDMFCSHYKSHEYFAESINSNGFVAAKCDTYHNFNNGRCKNSMAVMGEDVDHSVSGTYYLNTNPTPPFALSQQNRYSYHK